LVFLAPVLPTKDATIQHLNRIKYIRADAVYDDISTHDNMIRLSDSSHGGSASGHKQEISANVNQHDQQGRQLINGIPPSPLLIYQLHLSLAFISPRVALVARLRTPCVPQTLGIDPRFQN
jgi:hypothetical protein